MRQLIQVLIGLALVTGLASAAPERVITLAPNLTEIVYTLGEGNLVVGVTEYCVFPPEAQEKTNVGDLFDPSLERALALRPDLLIHYKTQEKFASKLREAGVETLSLEVESFADIDNAIAKIGEALEVPEKATALNESIREGLAKYEVEPSARSPKVLFVVGYSPAGLRDIYAAGKGTFLDEMIVKCGARNLLGAGMGRYPTVSREYLVANPPDVIIDCNESAGKGRSAEVQGQMRKAWLELLGRKSGQTRIEFSDDPHLTIPGPHVVEAVAKINAMIEGVEPTGKPDGESDL